MSKKKRNARFVEDDSDTLKFGEEKITVEERERGKAILDRTIREEKRTQ